MKNIRSPGPTKASAVIDNGKYTSVSTLLRPNVDINDEKPYHCVFTYDKPVETKLKTDTLTPDILGRLFLVFYHFKLF